MEQLIYLFVSFFTLSNFAKLLVACYIALALTKNRPFPSIFKILVICGIAAITLTTLSFASLYFYNNGFYPDYESLSWLEYNLSPNLYNLITQLVPVGLVFVLLSILLKLIKVKYFLIVSLISVITVIPWSYSLSSLFSASKHTDMTVAPKVAENLEQDIIMTIHGEEIVDDPSTNYKILRILTSLTIPKSGHYNLSFMLCPITFEGTPLTDMYRPGCNTPLTVAVNGVYDAEIHGLDLHQGEQDIIFDFPFTYKTQGQDKVNLKYIDKVDGTYGPYKFQVGIREFKNEEMQMELQYESEQYITRSYNYLDFYD